MSEPLPDWASDSSIPPPSSVRESAEKLGQSLRKLGLALLAATPRPLKGLVSWLLRLAR